MKKEVLIGILAIAIIVIAGCTAQQSPPRYATEGEGEGVTYQGVLDMFERSIILVNTVYSNSCTDKCNSQNRTCVAAHRQSYNFTGSDSWYNPVACSEKQTSGQKLCTCATP